MALSFFCKTQFCQCTAFETTSLKLFIARLTSGCLCNHANFGMKYLTIHWGGETSSLPTHSITFPFWALLFCASYKMPVDVGKVEMIHSMYSFSTRLRGRQWGLSFKCNKKYFIYYYWKDLSSRVEPYKAFQGSLTIQKCHCFCTDLPKLL